MGSYTKPEGALSGFRPQSSADKLNTTLSLWQFEAQTKKQAEQGQERGAAPVARCHPAKIMCTKSTLAGLKAGYLTFGVISP